MFDSIKKLKNIIKIIEDNQYRNISHLQSVDFNQLDELKELLIEFWFL